MWQSSLSSSRAASRPLNWPGNLSSFFSLSFQITLFARCVLKFIWFFSPHSSTWLLYLIMGTVICHPATDIAAQCSTCLPSAFVKKRGMSWHTTMSRKKQHEWFSREIYWRKKVFSLLKSCFLLKIITSSHQHEKLLYFFFVRRLLFNFINIRRLGVWTFQLNNSQSDDSVYKLAVSLGCLVLHNNIVKMMLNGRKISSNFYLYFCL